jgi:putative SOS response-associated peptidase YedK
MCGRFTICITKAELDMILDHDYSIGAYPGDLQIPRYNVAPGQLIISIINDGRNNRAGLLKWGFVPSIAHQDALPYSVINAKAETLAQKPFYRQALSKKRCVILADGFYEWKKTPGGKVPHRFVLPNTPLFPFAGIWNTYIDPLGEKIHTCAIVTTTANELVAPIHDRMPVILTKTAQNIWLDPSFTDPELLTSLLKPYDSSKMTVYPVSSRVNNSQFDDPSLIDPISIHA